jgi:hypothetical protein
MHLKAPKLWEASEMEIKNYADLKAALREIGYSNKAIVEITKWYENGLSERTLN